jgi:hypothetical protein
MQENEEIVVKKFPTRTQAVNFASDLLLDVEGVLIRHEGSSWNVSYNANRSIVYLGEENFSRIE